jgi:membrane protease YdiL (CAAX protease family)
MGSLKNRPVLLFFILSFLISWVAVFATQLLAVDAGLSDFGELTNMAETTFTLNTIADDLALPVPIVFLITRVIDFGPTLAGLLAAWIVAGSSGVQDLLRQSFRWAGNRRALLMAILIPSGILGTALLLRAILADTAVFSTLNWGGPATIGSLLFWIAFRTLLGGGLGEEIGWRGFAQPRLQETHSLVKTSLIIGSVWAIWHFPGAMIAESPLFNMLVFLVFVIPAGFTYTYVYNISQNSLLPVILMHGLTNGLSAFLERSLFPGLLEDDLWVILFILITLAVGIAMVFLLQRMQRATVHP